MKSYSLVKTEGLRNTARSQRELQNTDLSRPSEKQRQQNLENTREQLGMKSSKKSDPQPVYCLLSSQACCLSLTRPSCARPP